MLVPEMRMDAMEDAYRKPSLSGTVKTWVYQGDTYEESRNRVFADDQEDGDLTTELVKTGNIDTSVLGEQTISYEVTDADGNTVQMETVVLVLERDNDGSEGEKNIQRKLYTLPEASHLTDIGFDRGYYHDRQNLGIWLPADTEMKVRLVNHEEFNRNLELGFMNDDSYTESSASIPSSGEWVTVKNSFREDGAEKSKDSVPFIKTPKDISVQPIVEIEWKEELEELPYYRYGDDENTFFRKWDDSQAPFAVIEGEAATFLVPILDRDNIINRITNQGDRDVYSFTSIDGMLEWYGEFVEQYDRYSGLKFYPGEAEPYNQNVRAKFFIKANKHGAGAAYYSQDHSASNSESMEGYLVKNWLSLHEFGHGYEGAIAKREHPFVETTNNIMGYYFEQTYREGDLGWMLGYAPIEQKAQKFAELGESAENRRNSKTTFMGIIDGAWNYGESLFMFVNVLDKLGPENTVSAMHTQYRKYYYENKMHTSSSDVIIDSFSRAGGYNVIPYFEGWHIEPSKQKESQIYDMDLPMVYYLKNLIVDEEKCEEIRENLGLNGIYSLVSTDDLADTGYKSKVEFQIFIDNIAQIQNRNILIKNGEKIVKEVCVTGETISVELPVGIYEVELPAPRASVYQYGNEYPAASEGNVSKTFSYSRIEGNPVGDDMGFRLTGFDDVEIAAISVILLDENMDIGKLEYVPRTGGSDNGRILSYRIFYSITENRDDFQEVSLENCTWANNKDVKSVEFDAPGARRIRIAALSTAGDAEDQKNKFISAAEFRLYEKYKISVKNTYLTDMYMDTSDQSVQRDLNGNGQEISLSVNERKKTFAKGVGMAAGSTVSWDLEGKGFDTVTAWAGVDAGQTGEVQAVVEIYGDGNLLYRSETLEGGGLAEPVRLDIAGVKKLEIKTIQVKGKAYVSLADAKLINNGDKQEITLTVGESATVSDNKALMPQDKGKVMWSSSDSSVALVSEDGIITAAGKGDAVITAKYPQQTFTCTVHVQELSEEAKQALVQRKTDAETALETYKNAEDYREAQKLELAQAIADGKAAIEKAADAGDVNAALAAAKAVLDKIKTDAQLTQEENQGGTVTPPDKDPGEDVAPPDKKPGENITPPVKNPEPVLPKVGSTVEYGKFMYKILTSGSSGGTAAVVKPKKNTDKQIVVPDTIEVKGYVYRVTEISAKAFGKCKKLVQATVGKNVTKIGKQAFAGCKKLKKIIIKSTKIKSIGKKAFSKINKRAKIRVPKKKLKNYKKLLKKSKIVKSVKVTK